MALVRIYKSRIILVYMVLNGNMGYVSGCGRHEYSLASSHFSIDQLFLNFNNFVVVAYYS